MKSKKSGSYKSPIKTAVLCPYQKNISRIDNLDQIMHLKRISHSGEVTNKVRARFMFINLLI